jgi:hypothetical protein
MPGNRIGPLLALSLSLAAVGCGAGMNAAGNASFSLDAPADHVTTAAKLKFAVHPFAGQAAKVQWSVSGGDDETGPGEIDSNGVYTPPAYVTAPTVRVEITAALESDPSQRATESITVAPAVSVSPQNIALTPGSQTRLYASIAQVGAGAVRWNADGGRFSGSHCQASHNAFTQCSVTYTAPAAAAPVGAEISLHASLRAYPATQAAARLLLNGAASASPLENETMQTGADVLGTSGGNAHDSANQYCCGGTLGALLEIGGQRYVLSNNHVLARTDQASPGEEILQPGLLDTDCGYAPAYTVASLSYFPRLQDPATNVDAAIAQASSGALDPAGQILGFGAAGNGTLGNAPPARDAEDLTRPGARLPEVVKSGRTTGLTCGGISHLAVDLTVDYNTSCDGSGEAFSKTFTNQIAITGAAFADSGDSGALLADQQTAQPVGLIFSGNAEETFANPINDVLRELSRAADKNSPGAEASIVGGDHHAVTCLQYDTQKPSATAAAVPADRMIAAQETVTRLRTELMAAHPEILEVAAGASMDSPGAPAAVLYVDSSRPQPAIPPLLAGLRTVLVPANPADLAAGREPSVTPPSPDLSTISRAMVDAAIEVKQQVSATLRQDPAIFGIGVGKSMDNPAEAAISIFVQRGKTPRAMPATLGGVRVQYLFQDAPRAFNWKHDSNQMRHASCSRRSAAAPFSF